MSENLRVVNALTQDGELLPICNIQVPGRVTRTALHLEEGLSEEAWSEIGKTISFHQEGTSWWLGDWWAYGEHAYGNRKKLVDSDDWEGPSFGTCRNAATVCRAFETSRRRDVLSFGHHNEVTSLPLDQAEAHLDWAEETVATTGKPRSVRELRSHVSRNRPQVGSVPSKSTGTIADLDDAVTQGMKFGCIYADPPWRYDNQGTRAATGMHYDGMSIDELCAMPIRQLAADDAHLHLWTTNGFLFECPRIIEAWGFEFRSSFVWAKPEIGIGNYWRNSHEIMLTCIRGDAKRFNDRSLRSWIECSRGKHSSKPDQVRHMIERASPGPRLELFARSEYVNWSVWGNQVEPSLLTSGAAA